MLVKVAIDLALDRLFTYSVPAAMEKKLAVGQLLLVPFGYRSARGFALAVCDDADAPRKDDGTPVAMKSVEGIVDETPFFSPATLELVKTVAAYTASPVETVLKAAVPAAVIKPNARPKERFYVEPAGDTPQKKREKMRGQAPHKEAEMALRADRPARRWLAAAALPRA